MAKPMFKPDVAFDGQEFSGITRLLETLHNRKELGVSEKDLDAAKSAQTALMNDSYVSEEDVKALVKCAQAYKKAVDAEKVESVPAVYGLELSKLVKKLEGLDKAQETVDEDGNKVHPAAMPVGKEPKKSEPLEPAQKVEIVATPESKKAAEQKKK